MVIQTQMAFLGSSVSAGGTQMAKRTPSTLHPYKSPFTPDSWYLRHGGSRCVCIGCGDGFNSVYAFDRHQVMEGGESVCRDPATLGMVRNKDGWWVTGMMPDGRTFGGRDESV